MRHEKDPWMQDIFSIYDKMRTRAEGDFYFAECNGLKMKVHKSVYTPDQFSDSTYFSKELSLIVKDSSLLEIGTGTGIIGISCALKGANVFLVDVNPEAVKVAKENSLIYHFNIPVIVSDVYDSLNNQKFDYIFWSHPYNNWSEPVNDPLLKTGLDYNYNSLRKYISEARKHLTTNGKLLLGTGNTADLGTILKIADENKFRVRILKASEMPLAFGDKNKIINMILQFDSYD